MSVARGHAKPGLDGWKQLQRAGAVHSNYCTGPKASRGQPLFHSNRKILCIFCISFASCTAHAAQNAHNIHTDT